MRLPIPRAIFLDILYMTCASIFALSLVILVVFTITVYLPLRKIAAGANEYAAGNLNYRIKVKWHIDENGLSFQHLKLYV